MPLMDPCLYAASLLTDLKHPMPCSDERWPGLDMAVDRLRLHAPPPDLATLALLFERIEKGEPITLAAMTEHVIETRTAERYGGLVAMGNLLDGLYCAVLDAHQPSTPAPAPE